VADAEHLDLADRMTARCDPPRLVMPAAA